MRRKVGGPHGPPRPPLPGGPMPLRDRARLGWMLLVASLGASTSAIAQDVPRPSSPDSARRAASADTVPSWTTVGLSLESLIFLGEDEGSTFTLVSAHISGVRPGRVGPDISLGLSPRALWGGCAAGIVDAGAGTSSAGKTSVVLARAGASVVGATCASGRQVLGAYAGVSVLFPAGRHLALRLDATPRVAIVGELVPFLSLGFGLSQLPPALRPERSPR